MNNESETKETAHDDADVVYTGGLAEQHDIGEYALTVLLAQRVLELDCGATPKIKTHNQKHIVTAIQELRTDAITVDELKNNSQNATISHSVSNDFSFLFQTSDDAYQATITNDLEEDNESDLSALFNPND